MVILFVRNVFLSLVMESCGGDHIGDIIKFHAYAFVYDVDSDEPG